MAVASVEETTVTGTTVVVDQWRSDGGTGDSASGTMLLVDEIFSTQNRKLTQIEKHSPVSHKW